MALVKKRDRSPEKKKSLELETQGAHPALPFLLCQDHLVARICSHLTPRETKNFEYAIPSVPVWNTDYLSIKLARAQYTIEKDQFHLQRKRGGHYTLSVFHHLKHLTKHVRKMPMHLLYCDMYSPVSMEPRPKSLLMTSAGFMPSCTPLPFPNALITLCSENAILFFYERDKHHCYNELQKIQFYVAHQEDLPFRVVISPRGTTVLVSSRTHLLAVIDVSVYHLTVNVLPHNSVECAGMYMSSDMFETEKTFFAVGYGEGHYPGFVRKQRWNPVSQSFLDSFEYKLGDSLGLRNLFSLRAMNVLLTPQNVFRLRVIPGSVQTSSSTLLVYAEWCGNRQHFCHRFIIHDTANGRNYSVKLEGILVDITVLKIKEGVRGHRCRKLLVSAVMPAVVSNRGLEISRGREMGRCLDDGLQEKRLEFLNVFEVSLDRLEEYVTAGQPEVQRFPHHWQAEFLSVTQGDRSTPEDLSYWFPPELSARESYLHIGTRLSRRSCHEGGDQCDNTEQDVRGVVNDLYFVLKLTNDLLVTWTLSSPSFGNSCIGYNTTGIFDEVQTTENQDHLFLSCIDNQRSRDNIRNEPCIFPRNFYRICRDLDEFSMMPYLERKSQGLSCSIITKK